MESAFKLRNRKSDGIMWTEQKSTADHSIGLGRKSRRKRSNSNVEKILIENMFIEIELIMPIPTVQDIHEQCYLSATHLHGSAADKTP